MDDKLKYKIKKDIDETLKQHKYYKSESGDNVKNKKAAGSENAFSGIKISGLQDKNQIHMALSALIPNHIQNDDIVYVCIGTDRSTGDSLAPFVGTYLKSMGYKNVYGTIEDPVHALNLEETIDMLSTDKTVIAIDACLGLISSIGSTQIIKGSIKAGAGVGKDLPSCGDYGILGVVNVGGFMEYLVLQNTRLSVVIKMAKDITSAIIDRFPLNVDRKEVKKPKKVKDETLVARIKKHGLHVELVRN